MSNNMSKNLKHPISHHPFRSVTGLLQIYLPNNPLNSCLDDETSFLLDPLAAPLFRRKTHSLLLNLCRKSIRIHAQNNWDRDESVSQLDWCCTHKVPVGIIWRNLAGFLKETGFWRSMDPAEVWIIQKWCLLFFVWKECPCKLHFSKTVFF